jgi:hypothetical protein
MGDKADTLLNQLVKLVQTGPLTHFEYKSECKPLWFNGSVVGTNMHNCTASFTIVSTGPVHEATVTIVGYNMEDVAQQCFKFINAWST